MNKLLLSLMLLLGSSATSWADPADELAALLKPVESLTGGFQQTIIDAEGETLQQARGELSVMRPHRLRWQTQEPYQYWVITDGEWLWLYDLDLEQATRQPFTANLDQAPALLLSGDVEGISQRFTIKQETLAEGVQQFYLLPAGEGSVFAEISLVFARDGTLSQLLLLDNFGQQTHILFQDLQFNTELDARLFDFLPPDDVDVIINDQ